MAHNHEIVDNDVSFVIDPITRAITTESSKLILAQYDHNSEKYTFKIPRFVEGHDMSECDTITIDFTNAPRRKGTTNTGVYLAEDVRVDDDYVLFTWTVSRDATQIVGSVTFAISFSCHDADNNIIYEWGTDTFKQITVIEKSRNTPAVIEKYPDLIEQIKEDVAESVGIQSIDGVKYLDEKLIPDSIARVSDIPAVPEINYPVTSVNGQTGDVTIKIAEQIAQVQADWNQTDDTAVDYIKNRTHYENIIETSVVLVDEDVTLEVLMPEGTPEAQWDEPLTFENGKIYTVAIEDEQQDIVCENNELIFISSTLNDTYSLSADGIFSRNGSGPEGTYHIKIETTEVSTAIKHLDEKFIPDTIARVEDIPSEEYINSLIDAKLAAIPDASEVAY